MTILDFTVYIAERTEYFVGREWVFSAIDRWLADPTASQFFLLTGEPGIGKTAIAARLVQFSQGEVASPVGIVHLKDGFLGAHHFCSARNGGWISPEGFARSMSAQLANRFPDFAEALVSNPRLSIEVQVETNLGKVVGAVITNYFAESPEALFNDLVRWPLHTLCSEHDHPGPVVLLVDGLDEALGYGGRATIVRLLARSWDLPSNVRLLLTSRPVERVLGPLRLTEPSVLYAHCSENIADVLTYLRRRLKTLVKPRSQAEDQAKIMRLTENLATRSEGNFLVASKVLDGIERGELSPENPQALPTNLKDLYASFLERLAEGDLQV
ncbi:MAG: AAA family ATPase, partial [Anaerolineae bacterium]|nr:AAA family ATPase [Anaerolineae bacterium]